MLHFLSVFCLNMAGLGLIAVAQNINPSLPMIVIIYKHNNIFIRYKVELNSLIKDLNVWWDEKRLIILNKF